MIKRYTKKTILSDGRLTTPITGKILKVFVKTNIPTTTHIKIFTLELENILDVSLSSDNNVYYPINSIMVQDMQQTKDDYFYNEGNLIIELKGLVTGEWIDTLTIIYDE